ncbi:tetratricopeptide repeat protein [Rhizobium sp.]
MSPPGDRLETATQHHRAGRYAEAVSLYEAMLADGQGGNDIRARLASALRSDGRPAEALEIYAALEPELLGDVDFWFNRGNALAALGRHAEADTCFIRAIEIDPERTYPILNRAIARAHLGDSAGAIALYRRVLAIEPDHRVATHNLANLLADRGELEGATLLLRDAVKRWPDLAEAHYNLGLILLRRGDYARGAAEYEWRWQTPDFFARPDYGDIAVWDGRPFPEKRLVVHAEQGLGDTIQFAKLLGLLKSLGGDVILHVPEPLLPLLRSLPFDITVTSHHRPSEADFQIPLMSLIHRLKLTPGAIPAAPSYLAASPDRAAHWADRLNLNAAQPIIGLVWQGNPASPVDRGRSLTSAAELAPFANFEGVRLLALQRLDASRLEPAPTASGWRVRDLPFMLEHPGPDLDADGGVFMDTAAIMTRLDLVVSVCTAPLHLAGALGRPAIALLKAVPDWRWMMGTDTTPWYPTMSLERQASGEDFGPAIEKAVVRAREIFSRTR